MKLFAVNLVGADARRLTLVPIHSARVSSRRLLLSICLLLATSLPHLFATEPEAKRPTLLYSRYFNAAGESRYLPDGTYKNILTRLDQEFDFRVHSVPLNDQSLADVNVVLIANPSDKAAGTNRPPPHMSPADIA